MIPPRSASSASSARRARPLFGSLRPVDTDGLSASGRAYLLDVTFARHRFGISVMPLVALPLIWLYSRTHDASSRFNGVSKCTTCINACTPASVRPAHRVRIG